MSWTCRARCGTWIALLLLCGPSAKAIAGTVDFVRDVRPILERRCYECHGEKRQRSGLRLDVKEAAFKGGDSGPVIAAGAAEKSSLLRRIASDDAAEVMPPKGERLSRQEIDTLRRWIDEGAAWPAAADRVKLLDPRQHWSFQPVRIAARNPSLDRFIDLKLAEQGLRRSPPAEPGVWLRRVTLDLTGLPPTPAEVDAFLRQARPDYAAEVERLLGSPRYGERWAQHWLDVVRYADTHGFEVNTERPNAWPYRDYVIRAFNDDTPYDRFIREQIAGDALGADAATGFLVTASVLLPGQIGADPASKRLARQDALDEIVNNIGQTFLGLSLGCARCHDHKFDPIRAQDYYAMQAFVAGVDYADRELRTPAADAARAEAAAARQRITQIEQELARLTPPAQSGARRPMINARVNVDRFAPVQTTRLRFTIRATNNLEPCIDEIEVFNVAGANVARAAAGAKTSASGSVVVADRHDLRYVNDGRYGNSSSWMASEKGKGWVSVEFAGTETIERVVWGRDRERKYSDRLATDYVIEVIDGDGAWHVVAEAGDRQPFDPARKKAPEFAFDGLSQQEAETARQLQGEKRQLEAKLAVAEKSTRVFAGGFRQPDDIRLLLRGDPEQPREQVAPAVPVVLGGLTLARDSGEQGRRRALADWIASPENPLTARVMVNRIWQGHFGTGLVATPSDFGRAGLPPTHPELLDWLAHEFVRSGWSVKHLHRLIVLSATYRQASAHEPAAAHKDADVRLLWRYPPRRLEAEAIRDSMLAVAGRLDLTMYGRGFDLFDKRGGLTGFEPVDQFVDGRQRRMIYAHKVRRERDAVFGAFDCPDAGQSAAARPQSTTPIQALNLFNSKFTLDAAQSFAARVLQEAGGDVRDQTSRAYQLALGRRPSPDEVADAAPVVEAHGLAALCRALFNCNEFLFLP